MEGISSVDQQMTALLTNGKAQSKIPISGKQNSGQVEGYYLQLQTYTLRILRSIQNLEQTFIGLYTDLSADARCKLCSFISVWIGIDFSFSHMCSRAVATPMDHKSILSNPLCQF